MVQPFRFSATVNTSDPDQLVAHARRAEELGYSALSIADHLDGQLAPMLALTAAAAATSHLRLLTLVLANDYRHPAMVAKEATTLDQLSGGRLELGIGAGWMRSDYDQAGIDHERAGIRIARLAESVTVLKQLFNGEPCHFTGDHYRIDGLVNQPLPHQRPAPPIMIAGGGRKVLTLAGAEADIVGVNPGLAAGVIDERAGTTATPDATDEKIGWVKEAAGDRFDRIELQTRVHLAQVTDDRRGLAELVAGPMGMTADDALASPHALVGTVQQCVDVVQSWRDRWGISYIGIPGDAMEELAPVVEALAGR